jgi:hypothetical protein
VTGFPVPAGKNHPCPFCVTLGVIRWVLYAGSHLGAVLRRWARKTGIHPHFGASPCPLLADVSQRGLVLHDDADTPSLAFSIATCLAGSPCLAQDLAPFVRLRAVGTRILTIDDQSHARGKCCHPCTEGIGVDVSHETC